MLLYIVRGNKHETALSLLSKYVTGDTLLRHCKTVGIAMRYSAEKNGEDADYWESVGILHDIDFEKHPDAHCIACADIFACAMARPSKSVTDMELKSVTKKFKTPAFAAGCNCDVIRRGAEMMGMELNDVILGCLEAMRARHEECGC